VPVPRTSARPSSPHKAPRCVRGPSKRPSRLAKPRQASPALAHAPPSLASRSALSPVRLVQRFTATHRERALTHMHARTRTHTQAHARARTHTYTHTAS
jgi:hypothetical protein